MAAAKAPESTTQSPQNIDRFSVRQNGRSTPFGFFSGHMAYVYIESS